MRIRGGKRVDVNVKLERDLTVAIIRAADEVTHLAMTAMDAIQIWRNRSGRSLGSNVEFTGMEEANIKAWHTSGQGPTPLRIEDEFTDDPKYFLGEERVGPAEFYGNATMHQPKSGGMRVIRMLKHLPDGVWLEVLEWLESPTRRG